MMTSTQKSSTERRNAALNAEQEGYKQSLGRRQVQMIAIGGAIVPPLYGQIAATWSFTAAWAFQGAVTLGFALMAVFALARRPVIAAALRTALAQVRTRSAKGL